MNVQIYVGWPFDVGHLIILVLSTIVASAIMLSLLIARPGDFWRKSPEKITGENHRRKSPEKIGSESSTRENGEAKSGSKIVKAII